MKTILVADQQANYSSDDGLYTPEVGIWAEQKYALVRKYDTMFSTGMKNLWENRIYLDLFCGPGKVRIRDTQKIIQGSPLIALSVPDPFDSYIFCDEEQKCIDALKTRIQNAYPHVKASYLTENCNNAIDEILRLIPKASSSKKVLTFCFVDPFALNIEFETIWKLSTVFMDFMVLLALGMDAMRNEDRYMDEQQSRIDKFLGLSDWRGRWIDAKRNGKRFRWFLAHEFTKQMTTLGYLEDSVKLMKEVRSDDKNLPLYHMAFFSRHQRGYQFWKEVLKYSDDQYSMDFQ